MTTELQPKLGIYREVLEVKDEWLKLLAELALSDNRFRKRNVLSALKMAYKPRATIVSPREVAKLHDRVYHQPATVGQMEELKERLTDELELGKSKRLPVQVLPPDVIRRAVNGTVVAQALFVGMHPQISEERKATRGAVGQDYELPDIPNGIALPNSQFGGIRLADAGVNGWKGEMIYFLAEQLLIEPHLLPESAMLGPIIIDTTPNEIPV